MSESANSTVGIIGMGLMGTALLQMTGAARGWDTDVSRCVTAASADDVFSNCDVVFFCLPNTTIVRSVLTDAALKPGLIIIDTSTGDPEAMTALGAELAGKGVHYLDATVSGSSAQIFAE
jgi:3-hydroxyisobutyrate dehydrogenase-like beta-hydroxyacid dehydrogenase